nr:hypothetical protein [Deltaproteobacteria bacterium]MDQ3370011.1 phosphopantetheine-binding protein [Myxococcota bacterium]
VFITGRKDSVVKVNGQKVSLYEVEAVLRSLDGVRDACVVVEQIEPDAMIIAAVVLEDNASDLSPLRQSLALRLAAHKRPKQLVRVAALPLNHNNKIDRRRLLDLAAAERAGDPSTCGTTASPASDVLIVEIQRVLRGAPIDPQLSFLENGGDSLRALSLVAALRRGGRRISLDQLMSASPIGALVTVPLAAARPAAPARPGPRAEVSLPNRAFLEARGIPDLDGWSQAVAFDYTGALAAPEVAEITHAVLARHWSDLVAAVPVINGATAADELAALTSRISRAAGRVVEAAVFRAGQATHVVVACHQFLVDRTSWILLASELADGLTQGIAAIGGWRRPESDRDTWIALYNHHRLSDRASDVWAGLPWATSHSLIPSAPIPPRVAFRRVNATLGDAAGPAGKVDDLLLAAVLISAAELSGHGCQPLDVLGHGRDVIAGGVDASAIVGWFTVIWPFVLDVTGASPPDVVRAVAAHRARLAPIAHTFGNEHYRPDAEPRWRCSTSYNFLGDVEIARTEEFAVNPLSMQTMHGAASHSLELTGYRTGTTVQLVIDYDPAIMSSSAANQLASSVARVFVALGMG